VLKRGNLRGGIGNKGGWGQRRLEGLARNIMTAVRELNGSVEEDRTYSIGGPGRGRGPLVGESRRAAAKKKTKKNLKILKDEENEPPWLLIAKVKQRFRRSKEKKSSG